MSSKLNLESSVIKSLFLGNILEENVFPYPTLSPEASETIRMVVESLDKFMGERAEDYRRYDRDGFQPDAYVDALKELGLFGLIIPEEFGGLGLSNSGYARVIGQTSYHDASTALTIGAHSSIGMKGLLLYGTPEQKAKYLPLLASGEWIAAFCLTEPGAGSDAASIKTHAEKNEDGSWTLNGEKIWITNGAFARFFTVFARTDTPEGKITAFIVERDFEGVANGPKEDKLGIRASATTTVSFSNVKVPAQNVLGGVGDGFKVAMAILNNGRTGLGGGCVGAMKKVIAAATEQAVNRKQFGKSISEFGLIQEKLAMMNVQCFAAESIVNLIGHYIDSGVNDYSLEAAVSKIYCSEALWSVVNEGLQIAGGNGFMKEYPYERIMRDSRINLIFEGTNEILRLYIGLSALKDVGEYLEGVKKSSTQIFSDPIKGFGTLSKFVTKRVGTLTSFGRDRIESAHPLLAEEVATIEKYTTRLSTASETVLLRLGKKIVGDQLRTQRLADVSIDLFTSLCVLSRVSSIINEVGEERSQEERMIAKVFVRQAKRRINGNLRRLISNEDRELRALSESLVKEGKYRWDSI